MEKKIITEISRIKQIMNKNFLFESVIPKPKFIAQLINALTPTIGSTKPAYYEDFISALRVAGNNKTNQWNVILNFAKTNDAFFKKILNILSAGLTPNNVENIKKLKKIISDNIIENPNIDKEVLKQNINNVWEQELGTNPAVEIIKIDFNKFIDEFTPPTKPDVPVPIVPLKNPYSNTNTARKFLYKSIKLRYNMFVKKELTDINKFLKIIKESDDITKKQIALHEIAAHYMALKAPGDVDNLKTTLETLMQTNGISNEVIYGKIVKDNKGVEKFINSDEVLMAIMEGKYDGLSVKSWDKINDGVFKPLKEAFIGVEGSRMSTIKNRWWNYIKFNTFKNDKELLELAASRTVKQRIRVLIIGIIIQNYLIIPSFIAIIKSFTDKVKNLFNKDTIALRTEFIKDCNKKLGNNETCEDQANKIFGNGNDVESEKKLLKAFIKNWKESIPTELSNNPYTLNLDNEDLNIAMTVFNKIFFFTSIDDLAIGTIKTASGLYEWLGSETEKSRTNVTARLKCLDILKGVKDMNDVNKIKAYSDFEKCVNSTSPTPPTPPQPPTPPTNTTTTTPVVYANNEPSFIEFLKNQNPPQTYQEGSYSEDKESGKNSDNIKYYFDAEHKIFTDK
jgi:hypothetical protein